MNGTVRQITVATHPGIPYFLRVDFAGNLGAGFTLALSDLISAWNGEVSEDEVREEASHTEVPMERYVEDLHQALMGGGDDDVDVYSFQLTPDRRQLSYHKICDGVPVAAHDRNHARRLRSIWHTRLAHLGNLSSPNRLTDST
nr:DNA repair protein XRCC4-like [Syngnathus scovelli]